MPSRAARAPGAGPGGFAGLGAFPEGEIQGVFLFLARLDARAGLKVFDVAARELAVALVGADAEIDVAVGGRIGVTFGDKVFAERDHVRDVFRGLGFDVGAHDAQTVHIRVERIDVGAGDGLEVRAFAVGPVDDLVVDVGEVAYKGHIQPRVAEVADQYVEDYR